MKPQKEIGNRLIVLRSVAEKMLLLSVKNQMLVKFMCILIQKDPWLLVGIKTLFQRVAIQLRVKVNASGDEIIASNENQSDRAELDHVTVAIPGPSSWRVPMSNTYSQQPELYDVTTTVNRRAANYDSSIVSQVKKVPSIQSWYVYAYRGPKSTPYYHSRRPQSLITDSHSASNEIFLVYHYFFNYCLISSLI
ncbi:unnamed protein product [Mytilus edulis]|uniref:Uncharacterized protein n=1 Tax=Mytilus edulis TaxID=6550 RepID=A0A8S3Q483_MYTED|nr:unnamed protein product [Mytilus edulis]